MDADSQQPVTQPDSLELKAKRLLDLLGRATVPLTVLVTLAINYISYTKNKSTALLLYRDILAVLIVLIFSVMLFWSLVQVRNGLTGRPLLSGKLYRQPFLFLGIVLFLFFSIACVGFILAAIYLFSL